MSIQIIRRRRLAIGAAAFVIAIGGALAVAAPAAAYSDPPVFTVTPVFVAAEDLGGVVFAGECSTGSTVAAVSWTAGGTSQQILPSMDGAGQFTAGPYFTGAVRGESLPVTLTCYSGPTALGTQTVTVVYPDLGASVTGAATVAVDDDTEPSYDCGVPVAGAISRIQLEVRDSANLVLAVPTGLPVPLGTASAIGTPASLGLAVGDVATVRLLCVLTDGPSIFDAGLRTYTFTVTAAGSSQPGSGTPGSGTPGTGTPSGGTLPDTGVDALPLVAFGTVLIVGGIALIRRRLFAWR